MKRILTLILTAALLAAALALPASATAVSGTDAAQKLSALGLMQGTDKGFELERGATRAEALTMLLRLLGKEQEALQETDPCPFDDGGWAAPLITYAWKNGLVRGVSDTHFGSADGVTARDWLTMLLRALGYSDAQGDFSWERSIAFADGIGLTHGEYTAAGGFLREDLALTACNALTMPLSGGEGTLAARLYLDGVVSGASLRTAGMSGAVSGNVSKTEHSAVEIHERLSPAVFLVECFASEKTLERGAPDSLGSGFFITADGVAVMCYHEIDGMSQVRAVTLDGRRYAVTEVLAYDTFWDYAVVRVSRTDLDGNTVSHFPWLELGDSDAVRAGEKVYLLSNPLGLTDSVTDGLISNRSRNVDDPDYLCFQYSAAAAGGSSGGPLLNAYGEVIGVHFGSLINGENMNLAVPVNVFSDVSLTGHGPTVAEVRAKLDEQKAASQITTDRTEIDLQYGESVEVMVSHTHPFPNGTVLFYIINPGEKADPDALDPVECEWGTYVKKQSAPITITGVRNGEVEISFHLSDSDMVEICNATIRVRVTGAPEKSATSAGETAPGMMFY